MKTCKISVVGITLLACAGLISPHVYSFNTRYFALGSVTAVGWGALYGHLILPWYTHKRQEDEKKRTAANHALEQEQWRSYYRMLNGKYNAANIPLDNSQALIAYKNQLITDLVKLETALEFNWDDKTEKEALAKQSHYLKEHELQITKLIGSKIGQEAHAYFKDELALLAKESNLDVTKMSKLVYEKYGDTTYKFTTYKKVLCDAIMKCKQFGAPQEMIQMLENLNKGTNYLFANALDQERAARENVEKQEKLFKAELDNKYAIKDFYQEAQHHVQQASNTITRFSEEMDRQCRIQRTVIDSCAAMLQNITNMFTTWGVRSEQQTERIVYEVRQEGRATRDAIRASINAKNVAVERKINEVERKAQQAQQTAQTAKQQAATAQNMADVALGPKPPATNPYYQPQSPDDGKPSAPSLEDLEKKR